LFGAEKTARRSASPLEVAMGTIGSAPWPNARAKRLRIYRLLANSFAPLFALALVVVVLRWTLPQFLQVLVTVWLAVAALFVVLAVPWLIVEAAFALGAIKCPSCGAPIDSSFTWVPRKCPGCGYDISAMAIDATSNNRWRGP
jgi:hypothetical protein